MVSSLIVPFIALCILSVMVDRLTMVLEEIMRRSRFPANKFWAPVAYLLVFAASFVVCWRGHYDFFTYLNFTFEHAYEGWLMTALLVSGGSAFVKMSFGMMSGIPQVVSNVYSTVSSFLTSSQTTVTTATETSEIAPEPMAQEGGPQ